MIESHAFDEQVLEKDNMKRRIDLGEDTSNDSIVAEDMNEFHTTKRLNYVSKDFPSIAHGPGEVESSPTKGNLKSPK